jgi:hypothetical protein
MSITFAVIGLKPVKINIPPDVKVGVGFFSFTGFLFSLLHLL